MGSVSKEAILSKTHYGIGIYTHVLSLYYPSQTVLSLSGRTCLPTKNPFNADKPTLNIFIFKENILGNALDREFAQYEDSENAIPAGDPFDFAELHYKQSGDELLQTLNKEMNLHIGDKFVFYANGKKSNISHDPDNQNNHSSDIVVRHFSFFKAPFGIPFLTSQSLCSMPTITLSAITQNNERKNLEE
jgi:hypothetical protein